MVSPGADSRASLQTRAVSGMVSPGAGLLIAEDADATLPSRAVSGMVSPGADSRALLQARAVSGMVSPGADLRAVADAGCLSIAADVSCELAGDLNSASGVVQRLLGLLQMSGVVTTCYVKLGDGPRKLLLQLGAQLHSSGRLYFPLVVFKSQVDLIQPWATIDFQRDVRVVMGYLTFMRGRGGARAAVDYWAIKWWAPYCSLVYLNNGDIAGIRKTSGHVEVVAPGYVKWSKLAVSIPAVKLSPLFGSPTVEVVLIGSMDVRFAAQCTVPPRVLGASRSWSHLPIVPQLPAHLDLAGIRDNTPIYSVDRWVFATEWCCCNVAPIEPSWRGAHASRCGTSPPVAAWCNACYGVHGPTCSRRVCCLGWRRF